jgi:hypothetical protein
MNRKRTSRKIGTAAIVAVAMIVMVGCSSSNRNSFPSLAPVVAVAAESGTPQSHTVNGSFGTVLVAMVTSNGLPAGDVAVTFTAPTTGPSGTFAPKGSSTANATSNANGLAISPAFTANGIVGVYTVTASAAGAPTLATFNLTNTTGAPASITASAGNHQTAPVDGTFTNPLQVIVVDSGNNAVSNAMVVFTAPVTGASGTFADSGSNVTTAITNATGIATSAMFTANGVAGSDPVVATVSGTSSSASFNLMNLAGTASTVTATAGTPQNVIAGKQYAAPLTASVVDSLGNPVAGVAVTFAAPTTGQSITFTDAPNSSPGTITIMTNSQGIAVSGPLIANGEAGTFAVTATVAEVIPASFNLTNWPLGSQYYSFYLSGQEDISGELSSFYALAGSVLIDPTGAVLEGEQDFNDGGPFVTSPQPSGDTITGGSLTLSTTTYRGKLVLDTNNSNVGVGGVETFAVQFVNSNHALISQYDGSATSSGSLDLQTLPNASTSNLAGGYAFTMTGTDPFFVPVAFGGVFSIAGGGTMLQNGFLDTNDSGTGAAAVTGAAMSGTITLPDSFGRGTISIPALNYSVLNQAPSPPISLNYYIVGPEVIRIIDVDPTDSAVGNAYGQGANATTASNSSLGPSIFGVVGNELSSEYGAAGMLTTNSSSATFSGVADDDEMANGVVATGVAITGTYSIADTGYGNLTITAGSLGDLSTFGLYMTDSNLNLLDPNNKTSGLGGALLLDLDALPFSFAGGTGTLIPQTDTTTTDFTGSYAFGGQDQNFLAGIEAEFDFVGMATVASGAFSGSGFASDPFFSLDGGVAGTATDSDVKFTSTPLPDPLNAGRYTMLATNSTPNPLEIKLKGRAEQPFDVVMYQASGDQFFWLDEDSSSVFLGSLQQLGTFTTLPAIEAQARAK